MRQLAITTTLIAGLLVGCAGASSTFSGSPAPSATVTAKAAVAGGAGGFQPCPSGGPTSGEPPASHNGPTGACEAAAILFSPSGMVCRPPQGSTYAASSNCPLYPDLAGRLDQNPLSGPGGGADAVCRCQNTYQSVTFTVQPFSAAGPTTYSVRVVLVFGPSSTESFDVIVQAVQSGSLISDIQCADGGSTTSIMAANPGACT